MLDRDLAEIYGYTTKAFNQQVKNNIEKFPDDMMFQLTKDETEILSRSKFLTSIMQTEGMRGGRVYLPHAFTEQGIYMLMTVLKGELATRQSIALVRLFKQMRHYFAENAGVISRLSSVEIKLVEHEQKFTTIFSLMDKYMHDRFLIIDNTEIYHIGASLKDLGKKCFGFTKLEDAKIMIKAVLDAVSGGKGNETDYHILVKHYIDICFTFTLQSGGKEKWKWHRLWSTSGWIQRSNTTWRQYAGSSGCP